MEYFCDGGKFRFEELGTSSGLKYLTPAHWRDLGEKSGDLYSPRVSWSDVAINGVPLEKTFEFEDDILRLQEEKDDSEKGVIVVNSRPSQPLTLHEEVEDKRWMKRLEKLYPMNFQEAKKKRKSIERFPVKPKGKKQVRDEKLYSSADKFQEITDEKQGGESVLYYTIYIQKHGDYKIIKDLEMMTPSDPWWPPRYIRYKVPVHSKYCPPLHWLEPEVQWEKIWAHVDELKTGKKRDYHYYPNGDGYDTQPCIFFFEKNSDDLNYNFDWEKDYMNKTLYFGDYNDYY
jgi:hypothetical protein